jgi:hypothetical protein
MLVKHLPPEEREVPHEPGNHFSFRVLSADEMDDVDAGGVRETAERYGKATFDVLGSLANEAADQPARNGTPDPLSGKSERLLVLHGLESWRGPNYADECTEQAKRELDTRTRRWAALAIVQMSVITEGEADGSGAGIAKSEDGTPGHRSLTSVSGPLS